MALEEDSRDAMQHPTNQVNIGSGAVVYFLFEPPVKRARIEIQSVATAKLAIKTNMTEVAANPPTATDYFSLLEVDYRNDLEVIKEPLIHTIAILAIGAAATWGTDFMVVGHPHRSSTG